MNLESELTTAQSLDHVSKKCSKKECMNRVEVYKAYGNTYEYESKIMFKTANKHRTAYSTLYYFCSHECKNHFKKYSRCHKCNEDCTKKGQGTFIESLDYTLCNSRSNIGSGCISIIDDRKLEKRFTQDYIRHGYYKIDRNVIDKLLIGHNELKQIIEDHGNMVSYNMLKEMYILYSKLEVNEREPDEIIDEKTFYEYYNMIKDELLQ